MPVATSEEYYEQERNTDGVYYPEDVTVGPVVATDGRYFGLTLPVIQEPACWRQAEIMNAIFGRK